MSFRKWIFVAVVLTFVVSGQRSLRAQSIYLFGDSDIDNHVQIQMSDDKVVGLGLTIVRNGKVIYVRGYGEEDHEAGISVDPYKTHFRWASICKTLTAVVAVKADSAGEVDLDEDIASYHRGYTQPEFYLVPKYPFVAELPKWAGPITMRRLLTHTSGIQHYSNGASHAAPPTNMINSPTVNTGMEWALRYWIDNPLVHVPGTTFDYSTPAFNLAGVILEHGMDDSFDNLVQKLIAEPAGMQTLRPDTLWNPAPRRAAGYKVTSAGDVVRDGDDDISWKLAAGGYVSTVYDMGRYAAALLQGELLSADQMESMVAKQKTSDGNDIARGSAKQGLGWAVNSSGSAMWHGGDQQKAQCLLTIYRNENLAIAIMTNSSGVGSAVDVKLGTLRNNIRSVINQRLDDDEPVIQTRWSQIALPTQLYYVAPYLLSL